MRLDYSEINQNMLLRILKRNGIIYLAKRVFYRVFWGPIIRLFAPSIFTVQGMHFSYFRHSYNTTFINERTVEIPFFRNIMSRFHGKKVLEIGNVLSHYEKSWWTVVDKFEVFSGVDNTDILEYSPKEKFDLVLAISTFEHIGFDENPRAPEKLMDVLAHLKDRCMNPSSELWFSIPVGWNPELDMKIFKHSFPYDACIYLERSSLLNTWRECVQVDAQWFNRPYRMYPTALILVQILKV